MNLPGARQDQVQAQRIAGTTWHVNDVCNGRQKCLTDPRLMSRLLRGTCSPCRVSQSVPLGSAVTRLAPREKRELSASHVTRKLMHSSEKLWNLKNTSATTKDRIRAGASVRSLHGFGRCGLVCTRLFLSLEGTEQGVSPFPTVRTWRLAPFPGRVGLCRAQRARNRQCDRASQAAGSPAAPPRSFQGCCPVPQSW